MMIGEKEAQINQEKLHVYKERQELEMFKSSIMCTKCKEPVRDFGVSQTATTGYASYIQNNNSLMNSLYNTVKYNTPTGQHNGFMTSTVNDLEQSKMLRQLKMQALRVRLLEFFFKYKLKFRVFNDEKFTNSQSM